MTLAAEAGSGQDALATFCRRLPALAGLPDLLANHPSPFRLAGDDTFLDIACDEPVRGRVNRSHLRMTAAADLLVVFYRAGRGPGGGSYGYGGLAARPERLRAEQVRAWLDYLASGFAEEAAPRGMQTSFQYPVPAGGETP